MVRCSLCRRQLTERDRVGGRCAACGQVVPPSVRLATSGGGSGAGGWWGQGRWAGWAAGFGLLVPVGMLVMNRVLERQWMAQPLQAEQMHPWLGLGLLAVLLALLATAGGLAAAYRDKAWRMALCCGLALAANGLLLAAWAAGKLFKPP